MENKYFFDESIYSKSILEQSIKDFSDIWIIYIQNDKIVFEGENVEENDECFNEFMNYCIWLINE